MITVTLDHDRLQAALRKCQFRVGETAPLMHSIAAELAAQTEENFQEQGRPEWRSLSAVTIERREEAGTWPGQMLQVSAGGLAASVATDSTASTAMVGSNKPYAAMMHFGGDQSEFPHLWGDIPARPFLPMDADGKLQPEAEEAILDLALAHLETAARL